jgi:Protein of unknown function (DUF1573)
VLDRGQKARVAFTIVNHGSQPAEIQRIETSCPCLTATPGKFLIVPGEERILGVEFDASAEPDFRGGLSIEVIGRGTAGETVFETRANVEVRAQTTKPTEQ